MCATLTAWAEHRAHSMRRYAEAGEGAQIEEEAIIPGPIVLHLRAGVRPGPIEHAR